MPKKIVYTCQNCSFKNPKWEGRCPGCHEWNTLVEDVQEKSSKKSLELFQTNSKIVTLSDNLKSPVPRYKTGLGELDRVFGGGIVQGALTLLGGAPGIGKSTLVLQMSSGLSKLGNIFYVCSEESVGQTSLRAQRLGIRDSHIFLYNESSLEKILKKATELQPKVLIIDSIQSVYLEEFSSSAGGITQIRECCSLLMGFAKSTGVCVFIIGHVTKDGSLAGPRVLEHMVDTVLFFEGQSHCRILRVVKNRFGPANEIGVFQMSSQGLEEVSNPSEFFLEERGEDRMGSAVFTSIEGQRPLLCEIQTLTLSSFLAMPRRTSIGIDLNRLHLILAVLEKYFKISLSKYDVFLNLVGGLKIIDTASDVAIAASLLSSYYKKSLPLKTCFFGEIGLTGEIRSCPYSEERTREAHKLQFDKIYFPFGNKKQLDKIKNLKIKTYPIKNIQDLHSLF